MRRSRRDPGDIAAIFVHAGAGFHSFQNEKAHLKACSDAATVAMTLLKNGSSATDAVEMAIKVLEDREITNSGFGSNLAMDGAVECDATVVDHYGRSGACGAVSQIKNPISLARVILDYSTKPMALQRVPPNLLVGQGATDFAYERNFPVLPHDFLISRGARERWLKWKRDLEIAENQLIEQRSEQMDLEYEKTRRRTLNEPEVAEELIDVSSSRTTTSPSPPTSSGAIDFATYPFPVQPLTTSAADTPEPSPLIDMDDYPPVEGVVLPAISNLRTYAHSPLRRAVQPDGPSRETSDASETLQASYGFGGEAMSTRKTTGRHDGSDDLDTSEKSSSTLRLTSEPQSTPLFPHERPTSPSESVAKSSKEPAPSTRSPSSSLKLPKITVRRSSNSDPGGSSKRVDMVTDTVGAIAVDCYGNIAAGSSSGGIGMKHRGRTGPAALVGVGTAVVPVDPDDPDRTSVAVVTSGTGEHMATTMAAATAADRIYNSVRKRKGGILESCTEDEAISSMIEVEFMHHPGVRNSHCAGAIGVMAVKKTREGVYLYFAHNTDSFALASMSSEDKKPACTMSRNEFPGMITTGGRAARWNRRH